MALPCSTTLLRQHSALVHRQSDKQFTCRQSRCGVPIRPWGCHVAALHQAGHPSNVAFHSIGLSSRSVGVVAPVATLTTFLHASLSFASLTQPSVESHVCSSDFLAEVRSCGRLVSRLCMRLRAVVGGRPPPRSPLSMTANSATRDRRFVGMRARWPSQVRARSLRYEAQVRILAFDASCCSLIRWLHCWEAPIDKCGQGSDVGRCHDCAFTLV